MFADLPKEGKSWIVRAAMFSCCGHYALPFGFSFGFSFGFGLPSYG